MQFFVKIRFLLTCFPESTLRGPERADKHHLSVLMDRKQTYFMGLFHQLAQFDSV